MHLNQKSIWIGLLAAVAVLLVGRTTWPWLFPEPNHIVAADGGGDVTYICTETREVTRGPWQATPALNPKTQKRTVMIAFYCPQCAKWWPGAPPLPDRTPKIPQCPTHKIPLEREGPPPAAAP